MVATAQPSVSVRRSQQSPDLRSGQKVYQWSRLPLVGDGQHPLDESGVLWDFQCSKAEERPNRRQAQVSASCAISAVIFQSLKNAPKNGAFRSSMASCDGDLCNRFCAKLQEQAESIPIGSDRVRTCLSLRRSDVG